MSGPDRLEDSRQVSPRGVLYPARLPTFDRLPAPEPVTRMVRWFWIPEWDVQPGRSSRQHLIAFPACNLVVENGSVGFAGPATRGSHRDLVGRGWAVGALLRPAVVRYFVTEPGTLRDAYKPLNLPELYDSVRAAMTGEGDRHRNAVDAFTAWLLATVPAPGREELLANDLAALVEENPDIKTVEDAAGRLGVSARTLQRLARRHIGLTPSAMIRRRRLQEAAERLRSGGDVTLADMAADLGYSDHAHLANEFRAVLGLTLGDYRGRVAPA